MDRLARQGVVFEKALSSVPVTLPSHTSLFTGSYPIAHGVRDNGSFRLSDTHETLAEAFQTAGYRTAAFLGSFAMDSRFGLDQGFELYDDFYGDTSEFNDFAISERPAEAVLEPARAWLAERRSDRWFAFVHVWDPHAPYTPPPSFHEAHRDDPYTGEIAHVDHELGRFFESLEAAGLLDDTLIVLTADHGEGLGEHGESSHGMFAYETTLHVPLIFTWRGVLPAGQRVASRVRLIDVAPTIAELAGLEKGKEHQGESLVALMLEPDRHEDRDCYFEALSFNLNRNWAPLTGLYREGYKFIDLPIPELYNLDADPGETRNLFGRDPKVSRHLAAELARLVESNSTEASREINAVEIDQETATRLESLGYVVSSGEPRESAAYTAEDDPKRLIHLSDMLDEGVAAHAAGRSEEAIRAFQAILKQRPTFANAHVNLAYVLQETGRIGEAISVLERALENGISTRTMLGRLGAYLQEAGRLDESVSLLEAVVEENPTYAEAFNYLAVSYARLSRTAEAVQTLEKLLQLDPSYASAYSNLGSAYLGAGRFQEAEQSLTRALELDPRLASAWNGLGVTLANTGREDEAVSAWKRSVELDPSQYDTLYNLGTLLTKMNRFQEAIPFLERFILSAPQDRYGADIPKLKRLVAQLRARI